MIARDISQAVSVVTLTPSLVMCCTDQVTARSAMDVVIPTLRTYLERDNAHVVIPALVEYILGHGCDTDGQLVVDATQLRETLERAWASVEVPSGVEAAVDVAVAAGLDGELLCWEIITRESTKHQGLIHKEASKLVRVLPANTTTSELIGHGWKGLRGALRQFDPALGFSFSTYACPKINGAIRDGVRAEDPLPKRLTTFVRAVNSTEEKLTHSLSRIPTLHEIAANLDKDGQHIPLLPRLGSNASLEELANPDSETHREPACLIDPADPETAALAAMRDQAVRDAVSALPQAQAQAIQLLFLHEIPIGVAARQLGVDARALRTLKNQGLAALAETLSTWDGPSQMAAQAA